MKVFKEFGFWAVVLMIYSMLAYFLDWPNSPIIPIVALILIWIEGGCETIFSWFDDKFNSHKRDA